MMNSDLMTNVIIIGAGTGGASVARELSKNPAINIKIIEKGPKCDAKDAYKYYEPWDKESLEIIRTIEVSGSSIVMQGNCVPSLVNELKENYDIDITPQLNQLEEELNVAPLPESHIGKSTKLLNESAKKLGFEVHPMPKAIAPDKCQQCGKCAWGCPFDAKWNSFDDLDKAVQNGVELIIEEAVTDLIIENNQIKGVKTDKNNTYTADVVVVAAGGIETPKLLQKIGLNAGKTFGVDPFITIGAYFKGARQNHEVEMNSYIKTDDAVISPHTSQYLLSKIQKTHPDATVDDILSLMIKISDKTIGSVDENHVEKYLDFEDASKLIAAAGIAGNILKEAGADIKSISSTHVRGAHLICTARIGDIVDTNLETKIKNLYVGDGSVLPVSPGLPPIYTILALSRRLGQYLADKL